MPIAKGKVSVNLTITADLAAAIDARIAQWKRGMPAGFECDRADAIRTLVWAGLESPPFRRPRHENGETAVVTTAELPFNGAAS